MIGRDKIFALGYRTVIEHIGPVDKIRHNNCKLRFCAGINKTFRFFKGKTLLGDFKNLRTVAVIGNIGNGILITAGIARSTAHDITLGEIIAGHLHFVEDIILL